MISDLITMNGYGIYVWSSFAFTLLGFFSLYFIIKSQLLREQKKFEHKFNSLTDSKSNVAIKQKLLKEILETSATSKI